jgi:hypothetical protein
MSESIRDSLNSLNSWLLEGLILKNQWFDKYEAESKLEGFEIKKFLPKFEDAINKWYGVVAEYLKNNFDIHFYFHFTQLKPDAFSYPHPMGPLNKSLSNHLFALEEVILRIEERQSLTIRREIAEREYQAGILYRISYSDHTREVKLNNIVLTKTDFNSENDNCFQYIFSNPGRPIGVDELEEAIGDKIKKRLVHVVRDLGFVGPLKKIFFPVVTKGQVTFMNPISREYAIKHDLPPINFKKL